METAPSFLMQVEVFETAYLVAIRAQVVGSGPGSPLAEEVMTLAHGRRVNIATCLAVRVQLLVIHVDEQLSEVHLLPVLVGRGERHAFFQSDSSLKPPRVFIKPISHDVLQRIELRKGRFVFCRN